MAIDHLPVEMADGSTGFVHGSRVWDTGGLAPAATGTGTGTQDQHEEDTHSQSILAAPTRSAGHSSNPNRLINAIRLGSISSLKKPIPSPLAGLGSHALRPWLG